MRLRAFLVALGFIGLAPPSSAQTLLSTPSLPSSGTWTCEYVVFPADIWAVRCYDVEVLATYDPVVDAGSAVVWDVPLWGPPISDDRAVELVRAVLCTRSPACAVEITLTI